MPTLGMGTKIKIGANSIADLTSISGLDIKAETLDVTTLDSSGGYKEFIQGTKDAGDVTIAGYFNTSDVNGQLAIYALLNSGVLTAFEILFPSALGAAWDFNGIVTGVKTEAATEDFIPFEATIKVSGQPTLGLTASTGLSALALTGTGGALTPTFANGIYLYAFSGVTATSVTVTATAASHTLALYIDGVFSQALTSASASAAIAMAAVGSKKLTILAQESGKVAKTYEIVVIKTA